MGHFDRWQFAAVHAVLETLGRQSRRHGTSSTRKYADRSSQWSHSLARSARKTDSAEGDLLAAIPLLGRDPAHRAADLKRLAGLLAATRPAAVQSAAITTLSRIPDEAVPATLVERMGGCIARRSRPGSLDALLNRPAWQPVLLDAIASGKIPAGQIDTARRQRLLAASDAAIRLRAEKLFAGAAGGDRQKVIDDYKSALSLTGDKTRGKAVFAKSCSACHVLDGVGHAVGPDLAALVNKSPSYLLSEILDPSRNLDSRYAEYQALTKDERTVSGILAAETATGITLKRPAGEGGDHPSHGPGEPPRHGEVAHARGAGEGSLEAGCRRPDRVPDRPAKPFPRSSWATPRPR